MTAADTAEPAQRGRPRATAELGVCAFLYIVAALLFIDAAGLDGGALQRGPIGPSAVPTAIGVMLVVVSTVLAVDVLRGGRGAADDGEDVDLSTPSDWRTIAMLAAAFLANAALINYAGWIISGAVLFWGTAFALGSRHWIRDPLLAFGLSTGSFLLFSWLGIWLPAAPFLGA